MSHHRRTARLALAAVLALGLGLAACGRKGALDPPPSAEIPSPPPAAAPARYLDPTTPLNAAQPAPVSQATPVPPKKTFILDPLLR